MSSERENLIHFIGGATYQLNDWEKLIISQVFVHGLVVHSHYEVLNFF